MAGRAAIVGGGITGLAAAFEFHRAGWTVDVYEASDRWGGKILTSPVGNDLVDAGPDAILARAEAGMNLVRELDLTDELTHPVAPKPAYIFLDGNLHLLPGGTVLGVPVDPAALDATDLISTAGKERAAQDLVLPPIEIDGGMTIGRLCRERLGDELTDRLIDPLVGGINASNIDHLSAQAAAPLLVDAMRNHGSLIRGLAAMYPMIGAALGGDRDTAALGGDRDTAALGGDRETAAARPRSPVFFSLTGGVARIIERLVEELPGDRLHLNRPVTSLADLAADAVVLTAPAPVALDLLFDSAAARDSRRFFHYAGVSQVTVAIPDQPPLDASGILFPRVGGTVLTAATWFSSKWLHYQRDDYALIRLTSGRFGDNRAADLSDDVLVETLLAEVDKAVPLAAEPTAVRIHRWPDAVPQYPAWHVDRVAELRAELAETHPRVRLAGAAYDGIGIPACINSGRGAARSLMV